MISTLEVHPSSPLLTYNKKHLLITGVRPGRQTACVSSQCVRCCRPCGSSCRVCAYNALMLLHLLLPGNKSTGAHK